MNVAKAGIMMGAHPSQAEESVASKQCRWLVDMDMGQGSWERFKQRMQCIEHHQVEAAGGSGDDEGVGCDPRHELLSMLARPVGLDNFACV